MFVFCLLIILAKLNTKTTTLMRFKLALFTDQKNALLPFNYQYPLSAAIYKILQRADSEFAQFLHNHGYTTGNKHFKLFTFSDIQTPFEKRGDRMMLKTGAAELIVCFYMPQAAENFIKGLFIHQHLEVADTKSKVSFMVSSVESMAEPLPDNETVMLQPISPLVAGRKNVRGHYDYRSPEDADFVDCLLYNWLEKWGSVHDASDGDMALLREAITIQVHLVNHPPQQRLITIKAGTAAETKIRGYMKFKLGVKAPTALLELALGAGLGLHNAQGFGCVEIRD